MEFKTYGKINLFLDILRKRNDGYHDIETVIQRIDLFDKIDLHVEKNFNGVEINISCDKPSLVPVDERNLCYIACKWFMNRYNLKGRISIFINKNIPVEAGLGGGTSNGAGVIKALNLIYNLGVDLTELYSDIVSLGADFPYFLTGGTALCGGIGEKVRKLVPFSNKSIVIIKPSFGFSTREVYESLDFSCLTFKYNKSKILDSIECEDFYGVCKNMFNALEKSKVRGMEDLAKIKLGLIKMGAINSLMSGSGSAVYGIFDNFSKAKECYRRFENDFEEVFIVKTINE